MNISILFTALLFAVVSFGIMLHIKTDVGRLLDERHSLLSVQTSLRETMKVQQAELSHLTSPDRLENYANAAGMSYIGVGQVLPASSLFIRAGGGL